MAQLQFLDSNGLKSVLNKIKDTFVPKSRKIANIDLNNDITAEELGNNLKDYVGGKSAYEVAVNNGFVGSERRWLESLKGENAYELAQQDGFSGTEEEWLESLKGKSGVYLGSGEMPEDCNVQIDPDGETFDISDIIDQTYNPESENAQSGKAVAEALKNTREVKNFTLPTENNAYKEDVLATLTDKNYIGVVRGQYNTQNDFVHLTSAGILPDYAYESFVSKDKLTITQYRVFLVYERDSESSREYKQVRQGNFDGTTYRFGSWKATTSNSYVTFINKTFVTYNELQDYDFEEGYFYKLKLSGALGSGEHMCVYWEDTWAPFKGHLGCFSLSNGLYTILHIDTRTKETHGVTAEEIENINTKLGDIDTALDSIISLQESYIGGEE